MVGLSPAGETAVLAPLTSNAYVSLHSADPGLTGTSELSGSGYARVGPVAFTNAGSEPTVASNSAIVTFPTATANWNGGSAIGFFGLWTAASGGTFNGGQALTTPRTVLANDVARFLAGALQISAN